MNIIKNFPNASLSKSLYKANRANNIFRNRKKKENNIQIEYIETENDTFDKPTLSENKSDNIHSDNST